MPKMLFHILLIIMIGILTGTAGGLLGLLLKIVQHIAYGYELDNLINSKTFLQGVEATLPVTRFKVLLLCGMLAGLGWWCIRRYMKPVISIETAIQHQKLMPFFSTVLNALLQIITIGLGSPLGREKSAREITACIAGYCAHLTRQNTETTRLFVACAAGAGLAAIYNIPLAGSLYTLEYFLKRFHWSMVIPALATSSIAVMTAWLMLGNTHQIDITVMTLNPGFILWTVVAGPVLGLIAVWFKKIIQTACQQRPTNWQLLVFCLINFSCIGLLAMYFPMLLGNGKSVIQMEFFNVTTLAMALTLFILRFLITWSSFRAGAAGGLLTPSLAMGALLGVILGYVWNSCFTSIDLSLCAIGGAAAFLASAQKIPLTAIALIFEFTDLHLEFLAPILLITTSAYITQHSAPSSFFPKNT